LLDSTEKELILSAGTKGFAECGIGIISKLDGARLFAAEEMGKIFRKRAKWACTDSIRSVIAMFRALNTKVKPIVD
jgi:hypothetical protein